MLKAFILKTLKRLTFLLIFGSGWFAFSSILFLEDTPSSRVASSLPLEDINSEQFWSSGYLGDIPDILRNEGAIIAVSKYGFTDIENIALVKLEEDQTKTFIQNYLIDQKAEKIEGLWREGILCSGKGDLSFLWRIEGSLVKDFFEFCHQMSRDNFKTVKRLALIEQSDGKQGFSSMDIDYVVGTNYFVVAHGRS